MMKKLLLSKSLFSINSLQKEVKVTSKLFCLVLLFLTNFGFGQIAQRGTSTTATTTTTSLRIDKPTGVVEGDVMIVNISQIGTNTLSNPSLSGWSIISGKTLGTNGGTYRWGAVLYKVATASEPTNYNFTLDLQMSGAVGSIVAFSGVDVSGSNPFDATLQGINVNTSNAVSASSITTTTNNAAVIMFSQVIGTNRTYSNWIATSPNALTEIYDDVLSPRASVGAAWAIKATTGTTGTGRVDLSGNEYNGGLLVALKPKPYYRSQIISANVNGSSTWCAGETRTVSVVIKNTGSSAWTDGSGKDFNIGIKWNTNAGSWDDYNVRVDAENLAPGDTKTYYFNITASNNNGAYTTPLGTGSNKLTFDVVYEHIAWFNDNSNGVGPGNSVFATPTQTIVASPADKVVTAANPTICIGTGTNINVASSQTGASYQLRNGTTLIGSAVSGTGNAISLPTGLLSATTTFNVLATLTANSCPLQMTNTPTVTVNSLSTAPVATYTFCIDNSNTIATANVNSGQYVLLNVIKGYKYTFSVNDVFASDEYLSLYNAENDAVITSVNGNFGTSITDWIPSFSGQVKILLTAGANCASAGTAGGPLSLNLTGGGNTQETQNEYGTNTWVGHIYNAGGIAPEPFSANYAGYYTIASETINEGFGGDANCFPVYSNGVQRASIYTEGFAVRYKMKTTKTGCYLIRVTGDDGVRLFLNGTKIFDRWVEQGSTTYYNVLVRLDGDDDFVFDYYENAGGNVVGFEMTPFDANTNSITAPATITFCPNGDPGIIQGSLQYSSTDENLQNPQLNFQWQISTNGGMYTNIPGATVRTYDPPAIANTTTASIVRRFKRLVSFNTANLPDINNVRTACVYSPESNVVTITTNPSPSTPTVGTIYPITCTAPTASVALSNLPTGAWTITQSGTAPATINGSGANYTVLNLLAGTYQFTVNNGSCTSALTGNVIIEDKSTTTWNGTWSNGLPDATKNVIFGAAFSITADLSACSCTINSGVSITVPAPLTLNVTNAVTVLGSGALIFDNNASLVQDQNTTENSNTGNIVYKRNTVAVRRLDFTYWSSPVSGFTLYNLSSNTAFDKYYKYDPVAGWVAINNGTAVMTPGVGYIVRAPESNSATVGSVYPASFVGVPNNGDVNVIPVDTKWNLIGNPYPSALDAIKFIQTNTPLGNETIVGALYFWTHNTLPANIDPNQINRYFYTSDDYAVFNLTGSVVTSKEANSDKNAADNAPTGNITSGQGFFVKALTANPIKFTNKMRLGANNSQFFKTAKTSAVQDRLWLNLENTQGAFKQVLIGYLDGASNSWDNNYDATTFNGNPYIDFYSVNETKKLTIQGRSLPFDTADQVPLGYKSAIAGDFSISIDHAEGLFTDQSVYLEDKTTGIVHNLNQSDYIFTTAIGTFTERFVVRYTNKTLGTGDFENLENGISVSVKTKTINIVSSKENIKEVTIYDVSGKTLYNKKKVGNTELQIQNLQSGNQVLLVKVTLENNFTTTQKIIFQ